MTTQSLLSSSTPDADVQDEQSVPRASAAGAGNAFPRILLFPPLAAACVLALHRFIPNRQTALPTYLYPRLLAACCLIGICIIAIYMSWPTVRRILSAARMPRAAAFVDAIWSAFIGRFKFNAPLIAGAIGVLCAWDLATLKQLLAPIGLPLPLPYFPGPDMVLQSLRDDWPLIYKCTWHSLFLLLSGYALGAVLGIVSGVLIGWSSKWRYWGMPVLKVIGPIPATAFIPLTMMLFPTAFSSATALISLAVWFPVTMLTTSGIANVRVSLLDVARTLGARPAFLVFRVAIPAAMPSIFVGLFMGLGSSFLTLIVAETVGVSSGLGWYIKWAQAWADYPKVYAALVIMAIFFSGIMTLLFKIRDRVLVYQKGTIKW